MKKEIYRIHLSKENFKFSSAHMTVFPNGTKESIHGHNFQVKLCVDTYAASVDKMIMFSSIKSKVKSVCKRLDEKLLLPSKCKHLIIHTKNKKNTSFSLCKKNYTIPTDEIVFLNLDNITTELLAEYVYKELQHSFDHKLKSKIKSIRVTVQESPGQGAEYFIE